MNNTLDYDRFVGYINKQIRSQADAEDIAQDVYLYCLNSKGKYKIEAGIMVFIANSFILNFFKKRRRLVYTDKYAELSDLRPMVTYNYGEFNHDFPLYPVQKEKEKRRVSNRPKDFQYKVIERIRLRKFKQRDKIRTYERYAIERK